jgi:hypothetical protein
MLKKRDAQGLSTNVIILAVLGIIILFALIIMLYSQNTRTDDTLAGCFARGGSCVATADCHDEVIPEAGCGGEVCCVNLDRGT